MIVEDIEIENNTIPTFEGDENDKIADNNSNKTVEEVRQAITNNLAMEVIIEDESETIEDNDKKTDRAIVKENQEIVESKITKDVSKEHITAIEMMEDTVDSTEQENIATTSSSRASLSGSSSGTGSTGTFHSGVSGVLSSSSSGTTFHTGSSCTFHSRSSVLINSSGSSESQSITRSSDTGSSSVGSKSSRDSFESV